MLPPDAKIVNETIITDEVKTRLYEFKSGFVWSVISTEYGEQFQHTFHKDYITTYQHALELYLERVQTYAFNFAHIKGYRL